MFAVKNCAEELVFFSDFLTLHLCSTPQNVSLFFKAFKVYIDQVLVKGFKGFSVFLTMLQFHIILLLLMDFCICTAILHVCSLLFRLSDIFIFLDFLCYKTGGQLSFSAHFSVL